MCGAECRAGQFGYSMDTVKLLSKAHPILVTSLQTLTVAEVHRNQKTPAEKKKKKKLGNSGLERWLSSLAEDLGSIPTSHHDRPMQLQFQGI